MSYTTYGDNENCIEFLRNQKTATCSFSQEKYKTKIRKLAEKYPDQCQIVAENKDGTICVHVPTTWVKISPPRQISDEQREAARERFIAMRDDKRSDRADSAPPEDDGG